MYDSMQPSGNVASGSQSLPPATETLSAQVERQITDNQTHLTAMWNEFTTRFGLTQTSVDVFKPVIPKIKALEDTNAQYVRQMDNLNQDLVAARRVISEKDHAMENLTKTVKDLTDALESKSGDLEVKSEGLKVLMSSYNKLVERNKGLESDLKEQKLKANLTTKSLKNTKDELERVKEWMKQERVVALKAVTEKQQKIDEMQTTLNETQKQHQDSVEKVNAQIKEMEEHRSSLEHKGNLLAYVVEEQKAIEKELKSKMEAAEIVIKVARRERDEAKKEKEAYDSELKEVKHYCGQMEDEMAEDRKTWEEEALKLRERSVSLEERIKQLEEELAEQCRKTGSLEEERECLQIQLSHREEDVHLSSQSSQLRLSAAMHALRHYKNLEAQTSLTLAESQEREREAVDALQKAQRQYEDRVLELAVWKSGAEEKESRVRELLQRVSALEEDNARTMAEEGRLREEVERIASLPPPPPAAPAEIEQHMRFLENRTKDAERRLRDAVEEKLYLREKALECEELERELEETMERLSVVESRLRDVIDENADLRRRQYKW